MWRQRDPAVLLGTGILGLLLVSCVVSSLQWTGRTFPGFLVLDNQIVASAGLTHWPATRLDVFQAKVVAADGVPVESADALRSGVRALEPGTLVRYRFENGGSDFQRDIAAREFSGSEWVLLFGSLLLCGVGLCGMALGIRLLRGNDPAALGSGLFLWIGGVWALTAMDLYGPGHWFRVHAFHECLLFAAAFHMSLVFPQPSRWLVARPWVPAVPYGLALLLAVANQWWLLDPVGYRVTHQIAMNAFAVSLLCVIASQAWAWFRPPSFEARQRLKVVFVGTLVALVPQVILIGSGVASGERSSENALAFSGVFYPLSIGYAVLRSDLFEIDSFVRRTLNYLVVTVAVALGYMALLAGVSVALGPEFVGGPLFILASAVMATGFLLLRNTIQRLVDRTFFRASYDFRLLVSEASAQLSAVTDLDRIRNIVESTVREAVQPSSLRLDIRSDGEDWDDLDGDLGPVESEESGLWVPFAVEGRVVAQLLLTRPLSGRLYSGEDRRLLATLANQGAVAIDHALALERLKDLNRNLEARVGERTAELEHVVEELRATQGQLVHQEKMASVGQLVAGVAHEINNPLNFIEGNLHHIRGYGTALGKAVSELTALSRSPEDREKVEEIRDRLELDFITEDLDSVFEGCQEGVDRATTIVRDLRTFSRLDRGESSQADINELLDTTVNLLRGRLAEIEVVRRYERHLPRVECLEAQVSQVLMNLVANASDAVGDGGRIELVTELCSGERVAIEVRDNGPGIPPENRSRIFEPFFTTKEVGKGTGLGLAISFGVVNRHSGSLQIRDLPGGGTGFRVELPTQYTPVTKSGDS
ncbi:MAG: ATP-binding protein [Myxococcales bacterium]|nr:ATP-binding protein [Myxococcales bacterium]